MYKTLIRPEITFSSAEPFFQQQDGPILTSFWRIHYHNHIYSAKVIKLENADPITTETLVTLEYKLRDTKHTIRITWGELQEIEARIQNPTWFNKLKRNWNRNLSSKKRRCAIKTACVTCAAISIGCACKLCSAKEACSTCSAIASGNKMQRQLEHTPGGSLKSGAAAPSQLGEPASVEMTRHSSNQASKRDTERFVKVIEESLFIQIIDNLITEDCCEDACEGEDACEDCCEGEGDCECPET